MDDPTTSGRPKAPRQEAPFFRSLSELSGIYPGIEYALALQRMFEGKPYEEVYIPIDTSPEQRILRRLAGDRDSARRQMLENAKRDIERATFRTLYNLGGATLFKALSGAPVDTRLAEELRLGQQAWQRALEIERENLLARPEILGQAALQAATLEREEQTGNAREQQRVAAANAERQRQAVRDARAFAQQMEAQQRKAQEATLTAIEEVYERPDLLDFYVQQGRLSPDQAEAAATAGREAQRQAAAERAARAARTGRPRSEPKPTPPLSAVEEELGMWRSMLEEGVEDVVQGRRIVRPLRPSELLQVQKRIGELEALRGGTGATGGADTAEVEAARQLVRDGVMTEQEFKRLYGGQ